jgi:hypothetical protein
MSVLTLALSAPVGGLIGAGITASVAAVVAIYLNVVGRKREDRNRRRDLYSLAYRTALEWCEGIYRVRRRAPDGSRDQNLVEHFHDMQERIAYYQSWLALEAPELGRSYGRFLDEVMDAAKPLIQEAWKSPGRDPSLEPPEDDKHPNLLAAKHDFLRDVREHLSSWWWVSRRVKTRFPKETG